LSDQQPPGTPSGPQYFTSPDPSIPAPGMPIPEPAEPVAAPVVERVGRGVLFSLLSIIVGVGLTMILYQVGFIASITSFALAYAAIWLYTLGASAPPRKGVWGVIAVIVIGVALSVLSLVVSDMIAYLAKEYPDAAMADKIEFITTNLAIGEVWAAYVKDILMYVLFAGLGTFGLVRQLGRARKAA